MINSNNNLLLILVITIIGLRCNSSSGQAQDWLNDNCVVFSSSHENDLLFLCTCDKIKFAWDLYGQNVYRDITIHDSNDSISIISGSYTLIDKFKVTSIDENVMLLLDHNRVDLRAYKLQTTKKYCISLPESLSDPKNMRLFRDSIRDDNLNLIQALTKNNK